MNELSYKAISLHDLRNANAARQKEWCPDQMPDLLFRGNELGGECGEAQNVIKKLERERLGWAGSRTTVDDLADELADVVICADLTALAAGIDLNAAVARKFNATSEKVGLNTRLAAAAKAQGAEVDNTRELASAKEELRRLHNECRDGMDALSDIDDFWDACPYRDNRKHLSPAEQLSSIVCELNAAHDKLAALTTPPAPQPTEREKVLEEALRDLVSWFSGGTGFHHSLVNKAYAALAGEAPSQTDRAEGGL